MAAAVRVVFNGVRGSTPCSGAEYDRFGGSSSCVAIETEDSAPVILDLGTGLRRYGARWDAPGAEPFRGHVLLTHLHWDHVQGLPFFTPLHRPGAVLEVFGPRLESGSLAESLDRLMAPPFFFAGAAISLALTRSPYPVGMVYGVDLVGAAIGCLVVLGGGRPALSGRSRRCRGGTRQVRNPILKFAVSQ